MEIPSVKELQKQSYERWKTIPELVRNDCIGMLREKTPEHLLKVWKRQHAAGQVIGWDYPMFHFDIGMQIRNALREQLTDGELPDARQPDGSMSKNWDDYYMGTLQEFVEQELAKDAPPG